MLTLFFALIAHAASIEPQGGCKFILRKPEVAAAYSFPAGKLHLCGAGSLKNFSGEIYLERGSERKLVAEEGGLFQAPFPFEKDEVEIAALPEGISFTRSLPFERNVRLPAFRSKLLCDKNGACRYEKKECVFTRPKGKADEKALSLLKKDWEKEQVPYSVTGPLQEFSKKMGIAEPHYLDGIEHPDAFDLNEMKVYRNALLGHRPSQRFFFDPKWQKRDQWREANSFGRQGVSLDQAIRMALADLKNAHCLP